MRLAFVGQRLDVHVSLQIGDYPASPRMVALERRLERQAMEIAALQRRVREMQQQRRAVWPELPVERS